MIEYRPLGATGLIVSSIGMGCWGLGGDAYGPISPEDCQTVLRCALGAGINYFDTAPTYGSGRSEVMLSLMPHMNTTVIATKCGMLPHEAFDMKWDFSPRTMYQQYSDSLLHLDADFIHVYQLHSPPLDQITAALWDRVQTMKYCGAVGAIGVSLRSPEDGHRLLDQYQPDVIQVNFSMIDQRAYDNGLLERCRERMIGVVARTPFNFGFLTGKKPAAQPGTHLSNWSEAQLRRWAAAWQDFQGVYGDTWTPAQFALGFCLAHDIATVIPGMMTPVEVAENIKAEPLSAATVAAIRDIYRENNYWLG